LSRVLLCVLLVISFSWGCAQERVISKEQSLRQHYKDISRWVLPNPPAQIVQAELVWLNADSLADIILVSRNGKDSLHADVYLNGGKAEKYKFSLKENPALNQRLAEGVLYVSFGDIDRDGRQELILLTRENSGENNAEIWFNNGQGVFYQKKEYYFPKLPRGFDRAQFVDIDGDFDLDLWFTGENVLTEDGKPAPYQARLFLNDSKGGFKDQTELLLPPLPPGISFLSIADYDQDGTPDIFIAYAQGRDRLLINNGLGRFADRTEDMLPLLVDHTLHVDWADFDMDGDNDLLLVVMRDKDTDQKNEYSYFLENTGQGHFVKKVSEDLPTIPTRRVYLLDSNQNKIPDLILLTSKGPEIYTGKGNWRFKNETARRLPVSEVIREMSFGDITGDNSLDILSIVGKNKTAKLWISSFK